MLNAAFINTIFHIPDNTLQYVRYNITFIVFFPTFRMVDFSFEFFGQMFPENCIHLHPAYDDSFISASLYLFLSISFVSYNFSFSVSTSISISSALFFPFRVVAHRKLCVKKQFSNQHERRTIFAFSRKKEHTARNFVNAFVCV